MSAIYLEFQFKVAPRDPFADLLMAELGEVGFESFMEEEDGLLAYIQKDLWNETLLDGLYTPEMPDVTISHTQKEVAQVNWNEEWEKNFDPIVVDGKCTVRAPFHPEGDTQYDIVIEPKMSFGTGHHETTHMMIQHLMDTDLKGKEVLDMGCGTGVLAILAEKEGAKAVDAIDIDRWCYENSVENAARNACNHIRVFEGDASLLPGREYDVIIANINRNILLADLPVYVSCLRKGGVLLLSGFYEGDIPMIREKCESLGLKFGQKLEKNLWVALKFLN
ncbi:50S ribosomal protein L11 methyltransferase [Robertkochia sediminum]|uniref:50S ribosomal protein L11 methyltransferase n=1 Tax=Robertkochia sediminum TaxID=2785326 RepID=UPI00193416F2|nr:50S ribosomal protein L11 methyltransferase [Robertkochia sediminum]MBL7471576.1 50S ribosomal protein L11 methyltransferase [Robertkochia sediminum]